MLFTDDIDYFNQRSLELETKRTCEKSYLGLISNKVPVAALFEVRPNFTAVHGLIHELPEGMTKGASPNYFDLFKSGQYYRVYPINIPFQSKFSLELLEWRHAVEKTARRRGVQRKAVIHVKTTPQLALT